MSYSPHHLITRVAVSLMAGCLLITAGCGSESNSKPTNTSGTSHAKVDLVTHARNQLAAGDHEAAADSIHAYLVQSPADGSALFLAAQIESARGNPKLSADLAASIEISDAELGIKAAELALNESFKAGELGQAEQILSALITAQPTLPRWRRTYWSLLNRQGRRPEACQQADLLCQMGWADTDVLLSLLRRTDAYPVELTAGDQPQQHFEPGLGMARWYFTHKDYRAAREQLAAQASSGFRNPAAAALYGRILAELQATEALVAWHRKCNKEVTEFGDYWAAVAVFLIDAGQPQAAARALLEAVYRNPTDRVSVQRLAGTCDALGHSDDAEQFRFRGIKIAESEALSRRIRADKDNIPLRQQLAKQLLQLGRPFETLAWTRSTLPAGAVEQHAHIARQRQQYADSDEILIMANVEALLGVDPSEFRLQPALDRLLGSTAPKVTRPARAADRLATPRLVNVAKQVGAKFQWYHDETIDLSSIPIFESVGGGIAAVDYDLDGWPDLFFCQGSGKPPEFKCTRSDVLLRNLNARFAAVTTNAGVEDTQYSSGIAAGDVNQDGFPDLFVGNLGANRLLINNGDGTFRDGSGQCDRHPDRFTTSLAIADINGDSLPDLYESNYIEMDGAFDPPKVSADGRQQQPSPLLHYAEHDRWFAARGDGTLQVNDIPGEIAKPGTGLGVVITDFDHQRGNEIFVGNDVRANHYLSFVAAALVNTADAHGIANGFSGAANGCMGIATGDFDRNGTLDLQIANFLDESANLYLQNESGGFWDAAAKYGLNNFTLPQVGFGTKAIDIDRNGWLDVIVTNGHIFDMTHAGQAFKMSPQFLLGLGDRFELATVDDPSGYWDGSYLGRTIAMLDFDRSGTIDFVIGHLDHESALLKNETETKGAWIQFEFVGTSSERDAIGARVTVTCGADAFTQWVTAGDGYFCSDEPVIDLGLAAAESIDQVEVMWPSGLKQVFSSLQPRQRYLILENELEAYRR